MPSTPSPRAPRPSPSSPRPKFPFADRRRGSFGRAVDFLASAAARCVWRKGRKFRSLRFRTPTTKPKQPGFYQIHPCPNKGQNVSNLPRPIQYHALVTLCTCTDLSPILLTSRISFLSLLCISKDRPAYNVDSPMSLSAVLNPPGVTELQEIGSSADKRCYRLED